MKPPLPQHWKCHSQDNSITITQTYHQCNNNNNHNNSNDRFDKYKYKNEGTKIMIITTFRLNYAKLIHILYMIFKFILYG